ncbi:MAG: prepilin-type N-terminal cleavage/methylation domain-containing protein, partial [Planctomycetota bacterium]
MRRTGLTLLEVLVATSLLSVLLLGASELLLTGQNAYALSTGQAMVRGEAQRALDACVRDLRGAAAWSFATASGTVPGEAGSTLTPLTSWDEATGTLRFSFGPRSNVLFRLLDAPNAQLEARV